MSNEATPTLAVDAIIEQRGVEGRSNKIALVERKYEPKGLALPGGMVEVGETVEEAVRREVEEEIGLEELNELRQWRVFSQPDRDPREHVVSVVFQAFTDEQKLQAASDAASANFYECGPYNVASSLANQLVFDHAQILQQYYDDRP